MNLPNIISLSRIPILFIIAALLHCEWRGAVTIAWVLFVLGGLSDILDGYLARKYNLVSDFGKLMDAVTDKIYVLGHFIVLLAVGLMPSWTALLIVLILGREFLVTGLRSVAASKGHVIAAVSSGKAKTFLQLFSIGSFIAHQSIKMDLVNVFPGWFLGFAFYLSVGSFLLAVYSTVSSGVECIVSNWSFISPNKKS